MLPLSVLPDAEQRRLVGLLFDLDDTLLDHGRLATGALRALYALSEAGFTLVGVTGRPASWGQMLVRQWPVAAMVTENGCIGVTSSGSGVTLHDRLDPQARALRRAAVLRIAEQVRERFSELLPTDDSLGRLADTTLDIAENRVVAPERVAQASHYAQQLGARTLRSSVHLHLSLDADDKATGVLRLLHNVFGISPSAARYQFAFIGDSENDAACFAAFHTSIGVANLRGQFSLPPRYRTVGARSAGFIEAAELLLSKPPSKLQSLPAPH